MKYVVLIPDGCADFEIEALGGRTPLGAAHLPHLASLAKRGRVGLAHTTPQGFEAGSDVCSMSLLGYDPARYHTGRAPLEAAALGLTLAPSDWIFRLNFVTTTVEGDGSGKPPGLMLDHSAGAISDAEARVLLADMLADWRDKEPMLTQGLALHAGVSYRNILVDSSGEDYRAVHTTPPHAVPGEPWKQHLPTGNTRGSRKLTRLIELSTLFLPTHPVNVARKASGKRMATSAWIWGQGTKPNVPAFFDRFGLRGCMITSVDLLRGLAAYLGWDRIEVPGLTSYHDTDYAAQGAATAAALTKYDIVCCHVEAPDEASHQGDWKTKVASLEAIDREIVPRIVTALERFGDASADAGRKGWRLLVMPDHYTLCETMKHDATPVPFLMAGAWVQSVVERPFTEAAAHASDLRIEQGHDLMEYFLRGGVVEARGR